MSTPIMKFGAKLVTAALTTVTIDFNVDEVAGTPADFPAGYVIAIVGTPDWATSVRVSNTTVAEAVFTFGTAAPAYGGVLLWIAIGRYLDSIEVTDADDFGYPDLNGTYFKTSEQVNGRDVWYCDDIEEGAYIKWDSGTSKWRMYKGAQWYYTNDSTDDPPPGTGWEGIPL